MIVSDFEARTPEQVVDTALQTYARTGMYPNSQAMHECAMQNRRELIRIVTEWREMGGKHQDQLPE